VFVIKLKEKAAKEIEKLPAVVRRRVLEKLRAKIL